MHPSDEPVGPETGPAGPHAGPADPDAGPVGPDAGPVGPDAGEPVVSGESRPRPEPWWSFQRSSSRPWSRTVAAAAGSAAAVAALGVALGLLWAYLAPGVPVVDVGDNGVVVNDPSPEQYIAADGWFTLLGLAFGVLAAVGAWLVLRRDRGPFLLAGVVGGAFAAGHWVAPAIGEMTGRGAYEDWRASAAQGATYLAPPEIHSLGPTLVPAFVAAIVLTLLAGWSNDPDLDQPGAQPGYGPNHPDEHPGPGPSDAAAHPGYGPGDAAARPGYGPGDAGARPGYGLGDAGARPGYGLGDAGARPGYGPGHPGEHAGHDPADAAARSGYGPGDAGARPGYGPDYPAPPSTPAASPDELADQAGYGAGSPAAESPAAGSPAGGSSVAGSSAVGGPATGLGTEPGRREPLQPG